MLTRLDQFETSHTIRLSIFTFLSSKKHFEIPFQTLFSFIDINKDSISKDSIKRLESYIKEDTYIGFLNPTGTNILLRNIEDNVDKNKRHNIYVVIDRVIIRKEDEKEILTVSKVFEEMMDDVDFEIDEE